MLEAVKRYAIKILLLHLALLVVVVFFVLAAARQVQLSARQEAQDQGRDRLQLVADQTASGLESHYRSILSALDVVLHDDSPATMPAAATTAPANGSSDFPPAPPGFGGRRNGNQFGGRGGGGLGRGGGFGNRLNLDGPINVNENTLSLLWRQLGGTRGPVSQIFLVNASNGTIVERNGGGGGVGGGGQTFTFVFPQKSDSIEAAKRLVNSNIAWLKQVKDAQMSSFMPDGASLPGATGGGYHLIALPAVDVGFGPGAGGGGLQGLGRGGLRAALNGGGGGQSGRFGGPGPGGPGGPGDLAGGPGGPGAPPGAGGGPDGPPPRDSPPSQFVMVVVVPINTAADEFLTPLNTPQEAPATAPEVSAILVNEDGQVLVSNKYSAAGTNLLNDIQEAGVRDQLKTLVTARTTDTADVKSADSTVFSSAFHIRDARMLPQILASSQFAVPSGHRWTVLIFSPLSDSDLVVNRLFRAALSWAIFVSLAVTAILISTSVFMIRNRVRFERTRHQLLTRELEQARHIQLAWLPDLKSVPAGLEVSAANVPASHISGDFYNWFPLPVAPVNAGPKAAAFPDPSGKVAIVIGDVTGHGMAAAFLMATTQLLVRMTLARYPDPGRCLREVNQQLCMQAGAGFRGQFVTMLVMLLDPKTGIVQVASAGHPTPLVETDGIFKSLEIEPQLVLGVDIQEQYHSQTFTIEPGAAVMLYTDGVVEAENDTGTQYGVEKLIALLQAQESGSEPGNYIRAVLDDVKRFSRNRDLLDDVTLVAIRTTAAPVETVAASEHS